MTIKEEIEALKQTNEHLGNIINELNKKIDYLIEYQTNSWEIKDKQMIIYDKNSEVLEVYDLFNANNNPTNTSVFKRVKK